MLKAATVVASLYGAFKMTDTTRPGRLSGRTALITGASRRIARAHIQIA